MIKINETKNEQLVKIFKNRFEDTTPLWAIVKDTYKKNKKMWSNKPDWLASVPRKRSKVMDNRIFLATESQLNKVTARPVKPGIIPANGTEEAQGIAESLQAVFLDGYKERGIKKTLKRGLRFLQFSRLMCIKIFWNQEIDDYDAKVVDSRKVRFSKNSTCEKESEIAIEVIDDKTILQLIETFPDKESDILSKTGISKEHAIETNVGVTYHEVWIGDGVFWEYKNLVLKKQRNPFYDFDGLLLTPEEMAEVSEIQEKDGERLPKLNGRRRRRMFAKFKDKQEERSGEEENGGQYESYLYNHFNKPRKPYIFGTILEVEDSPIGETSLIEMVTPLQIGVDKRKRQIDDNSDQMNGITKVDTDITTMTLADARRAHYDPEGLVYGPGVNQGVTRETGQSLPTMVFDDMQDSRGEIDEIFGTTGTFKGTGEGSETATGRAILREEGYSRLDEVISLVDYFGQEIYNWWFQLIKVRYTESHLVKIVGADKAIKTIDLMQDDLQDGIEIKIIPGQSLPEDKMFRSEKAKEDMEAGVIDLVTYLKATGGYDNPEEVAKRAMMFKTNPFSIIDLDEEDIKRIMEAQKLLAQMNPMESPEPDGQGVADARKRIEQLVNSPEFQQMEPEEQQSTLQKLKQQFQKVDRTVKPQQ